MNAAQPAVRAVSEVVSFSLRGSERHRKLFRQKRKKRKEKGVEKRTTIWWGGLSIMYPLATNGIFPHEVLGISRSRAHGSGSPANGGDPGELGVSQGAPQRKSHKYARIRKMLENVFFLRISTKVGYIKGT
jgi:hypothetical protein